MPKNAYFGHYPSPNLIIVPTVNFCHPPPPTGSGWRQIADPITNSPTISCEQISPVKDIGHPLPYVSDCNHQNLQQINAETFFNNTSTPEFSDKFQKPPIVNQNTISTRASSSNIRQSIKELSVSKYQSNNNLVDLTGFNLMKKDSVSSLSKRQNLKQIDDNKIEPDKIKTSTGKELRYCSDSDTCKSDNKTKGFARNIESMITNGEGNPENEANGKPKENTKGNMRKFHRHESMITNGEGNPENEANGKPKENTKSNMQKFHRQLWKRYIENFKDKAAKEKLGSVTKGSSNKKRQESKEPKHESCKSKAHSQTSSKKYRELERRFIAKYREGSKIKTKFHNLQDSKVSVRDKKIGLSSDAMQRYKDFKRFIRHCDEIKNNKYSENQLKTKSLPHKKKRDESCETPNTIGKPDVKKKMNAESKQYIKSEKHNKVSTIQNGLEKDKNNTNIEKAIVQTNTDKTLIKNIVRGDRNLPSKISQRVGVKGVDDLRSKISRKRLRSDCFVHNQELMENSLDRESLVEFVKQDVEADSENSPIFTPPIDEPKAKKCKNIESIKNTKYNLSQTLADSGDICQDPPEDFSFLDDLIIHADEIVASLPRSSKLEHLLCSSLTMTTTDNIKSELNKKISANGNKDNEEANPKNSLINYDSMESIEINKIKGLYSKNDDGDEDLNNHFSMKANEIRQEEETSLDKRLENNKLYCSQNNEEINSDTEDEDINFEIGSIANNKKHDHNAKNDRNSQLEENNTDMTEKVYAEIWTKKGMRLCKDKQTIIITITGIKTKKEANNNTNSVDLTEKHDAQNTPKESTSKAKKKITTNSKYEIHNQQAKNMADLTEKSYEENSPKETLINCNAKQKITTDSKYETNTNEEVNKVADLTEKVYEENALKETTNICKAKQILTTKSKYEINTNKETNNMADLTGNAFEENTPEETMIQCNAKQKITTNSKYEINTNEEANNMVDLTENAYEENEPKETMSLCKTKQKITTISKCEINTKEEANNMADLTGNAFEENRPEETMIQCNAKQKITTNSKYEINTNEEANNMVDLTENAYEENEPKETMSLCKTKQKITTISKCEINTIEEANNIVDLTEKDYEENETCKAKQKTTISKCKTNENEEANNMADLTEKAYDGKTLKETTSLFKAKQKIKTDTKYNVTGKVYKKITPKETTSPGNAIEKNIKNSKYEVNIIQEANDVTDLTGKDHEKLVPKNTRRLGKAKRKTNSENEINTNKIKKHANDLTVKDIRVELCDDSDDSVVEVIDITDDNERNNKTSKSLQPKVNRSFVVNKSHKPNVNKQTDLSSNAKVLFRERDGETPVDSLRVAFETEVKQKSESSNTDQKQTQSHKFADSFETTLQSEFTIEANTSVNYPGVISDMLKQVNTKVETMFNNSDQNGTNLKHSEPYQIHGCAKKSKENSLQKPLGIMEVPLETISNCTNQQDIGIYKPSLSSQPINKEIIDVLKTAQSTIEPISVINLLDHDKNGNEKLEIELTNVDKHIKIEKAAQESVNQILLETTKNTSEQDVANQIDTSPINVSNIQENVSQKSGIDIAPLCRSDETFKEQVQTFEYASNKLINDIEKTTQNGSENSSTETPETVNSNIAQNKEAKSETLQISEKKLEQKADSRIQSNMSDKNVERKNISFKKTELIISEQSREKIHTHTTNKVTKPDRNIEDPSEKAEVLSVVSDGRRNKDETKSNQQGRQFSPRVLHYKLQLGLRMSEYLQKKYTISAVIHVGHFSTIYKCIDIEGGAYHSLKVVHQRTRGKFMEGVFSQLQRYRPRQSSCILYLMNAFEFQGRWCLLTEYFPKNLEQVLYENKRGFHIDQVQVLSRQLVYAVNMLASASIIHTDIKPTHILLNSAQDSLKLCGFDRSDYCSGINITPSTGSPKYRAPEVILGFQANHRIDVWSTGLVIFEMATNKSLFNASFNNELLYEQLCTFGSFDWKMVEQSRYRNLHFSGLYFTRRIGPKEQQKIIMINTFERNDNLRKILFGSYHRYWTQDKSRWQITKETDKLETLHTLLEQMLTLDPRHRLPIHFVNASEFMTHTLTIA